jgi:hypothetical protein
MAKRKPQIDIRGDDGVRDLRKAYKLTPEEIAARKAATKGEGKEKRTGTG